MKPTDPKLEKYDVKTCFIRLNRSETAALRFVFYSDLFEVGRGKRLLCSGRPYIRHTYLVCVFTWFQYKPVFGSNRTGVPFFRFYNVKISKRSLGFRTRVAPRLTENRIPGGGYPEPSEPESSRSNSQNRGYFYPGYPGTRQLFNTEPPRLYNRVFVDLYTTYTAAAVPLDSHLSALQTTNRE